MYLTNGINNKSIDIVSHNVQTFFLKTQFRRSPVTTSRPRSNSFSRTWDPQNIHGFCCIFFYCILCIFVLCFLRGLCCVPSAVYANGLLRSTRQQAQRCLPPRWRARACPPLDGSEPPGCQRWRPLSRSSSTQFPPPALSELTVAGLGLAQLGPMLTFPVLFLFTKCNFIHVFIYPPPPHLQLGPQIWLLALA